MSSASSSCRIDWRPSRLLCLALVALGALAAIAVALSDFGAGWKFLLGALALARGAQLARREWNLPPCTLSFELEGGEPVILQAGREESMHQVQLALRGVLVALRWRNPAGRACSLRWAPDTLAPVDRRCLRLRFAGAAA